MNGNLTIFIVTVTVGIIVCLSLIGYTLSNHNELMEAHGKRLENIENILYQE